MTNPPDSPRPVRDPVPDAAQGGDDVSDRLSPADRLALALGTVPVPAEDLDTP